MFHSMRMIACAAACAALIGAAEPGLADPAPPIGPRVEAALTNVITLQRPRQDGLATFWDGNKYVQCRWMPERNLRCEAAGTLMQPSLASVLSPERIAKLTALGWQLDSSFGNYVRVFPAGFPVGQIAEVILQALRDGYDADLTRLEVKTDWIASVSCPPRNGPDQNLAGMINDSPTMAATAIRVCAYKPAPQEILPVAHTAAELNAIYGTRVLGEIQRLRVNVDRWVYVVLGTDGGYIQCGTEQQPPGIYCEAQSAETWPVVARILTPERLEKLHAAGYADPGRAPNYWKVYPLDKFSDGDIAKELLTIL
jgi:hypothetical protein